MREKEYLIRADTEAGLTLFIGYQFGGYYVMIQQLTNGKTPEKFGYDLYGPYKAIGYASRQLKILTQECGHKYTKFYYKSKRQFDKYGAFINKTLPNITEK